MYRQYLATEAVSLLVTDRRRCVVITNIIIMECLAVFAGSATITYCVWDPDVATTDFDKLARNMYLFDSEACGHIVKKSEAVINVQFSNETFGLKIRPIKWQPALETMSTRLTAKTINYIKVSLVFHIVWMLLAVLLQIFARLSTSIKYISYCLSLFIYGTASIICFDVSMAIVYATHITQSLTKGMILRHSGWSGRVKLSNNDDFAAWLPMVATICWLKGGFLFGLNVYCCKIVYSVRKRIQRREASKHILAEGNQPFPEPISPRVKDEQVLIYRRGEKSPYLRSFGPLV